VGKVIMSFPLLSTLIWLPILSGLLLLIYGKCKSYNPLISQGFALCISIVLLVLCIPLIMGFDTSSYAMQWTEQTPWIASLGIQYALGIDGFSLPLVILSCFMTLLVVLSSYHSVKIQINPYLAAFLIMEGLMIGVFAAVDAILFYTFWEAMLVPMFLIIGFWGGQNRIYATFKFFLYTFLGSVLLLIAIVYLHWAAKKAGVSADQVFNILSFQDLSLNLSVQKALFLAFVIAFSVKIPMVPVHTWLPDAHTEAPTGGSVILAAILLKMGGYGFIRFVLPITPDASRLFSGGMIGLSLIAIVYIALVTLVQKDMKKLIAYSSISHMGFVTLGLFIGSTMGFEGAMVQMISHGFVSGALFLCVGVLYDRLHSRKIADYGGIANKMPVFSVFLMLFAMANVALPGTSGFVGEFLVILSAFKANVGYAVLAGTTLILGAAYTLSMVKRILFGPIRSNAIAMMPDVNKIEKMVLGLLAIVVLVLGCWPAPLLKILHASSEHLLEQVNHSKH
jgi:NADH-quinone oxidoreductase subunit M